MVLDLQVVSIGGDKRSQAFGSKEGIEVGREVAVAIVDEEAGSDLSLLKLPGQVTRLLGGPVSAGVLATRCE
jgi:hypothetical protein